MSLTCYITFVLTVAVSTVLASNISTLNHGSGCNLLVPEHVRDRMEPVKEPLNIVVILHMHVPLKKILLPAMYFSERSSATSRNLSLPARNFRAGRLQLHIYRVAHLLRERFMLTSNSKFRHWPRSQDKFTAKRNFKFGVNISLSRSRWATLYYMNYEHEVCIEFGCLVTSIDLCWPFYYVALSVSWQRLRCGHG